jgi:hypothetical protein
MRWVKAAEFLSGQGDWRVKWGWAKIAEVLRIKSDGERQAFLKDHHPGRLSFRGLREAVSAYLGKRRSLTIPTEPHEVLERTVRLALEREGLGGFAESVTVTQATNSRDRLNVHFGLPVNDARSGEVMSVASRVVGAVALARSAWRKTEESKPHYPKQPCTVEEIAVLPPSPLTATWETADLVGVHRAGHLIRLLPVAREERSRICRPNGNSKTREVVGVVNSVHKGCLRAATGLGQADVPCYAEADGSGGCYVGRAPYAQTVEMQQQQRFSVVHNGLRNEVLKLRLPTSGSASLAKWPRKLWRVDAESSDGALSISLGVFQMWAEANPAKRFVTICSHGFRPSDEMLLWLAALPNVWVGNTLSAWFAEDELESRVAAVRRFIGFGVPTVIWITTHPQWDNKRVLRRAQELVDDDHIIEYPYNHDGVYQPPVLHVNRRGACGQQHFDEDKRQVAIEWDEHGNRTARLTKGPGDPYKAVWTKCRKCPLLCGYPAVWSARTRQQTS